MHYCTYMTHHVFSKEMEIAIFKADGHSYLLVEVSKLYKLKILRL